MSQKIVNMENDNRNRLKEEYKAAEEKVVKAQPRTLSHELLDKMRFRVKFREETLQKHAKKLRQKNDEAVKDKQADQDDQSVTASDKLKQHESNPKKPFNEKETKHLHKKTSNKSIELPLYDKHFGGDFPLFVMHELPVSILGRYISGPLIDEEQFLIFTYMDIPPYGDIPFYSWSLYSRIETNKIPAMELLTEYAKGFLKGIKSEFIADNPQYVKDLVLQEVFAIRIGFPMVGGNDDGSNEDFYGYGIRVGRQYKAWSIVFQNPRNWESDFLNRQASKV
ncbi:MAG TPA: hypothetical protein VE978_24980 [Chitinophagales bacterium]|nr:hypothetical protein [Chitinophagales bacterium]